MATPTRAIIYIASGPRYIEEARVSARSTGGKYPVILCTPNAVGVEPPFDDILKLPRPERGFWYHDSVNYVNIALASLEYDQLLLLDTDTYVCGDLADFFTVLDRFDIAGTHAIGRETQVRRKDIPLSFPELHVGAVSFWRNERVTNLFRLWLDIYNGNPAYFDNNDQGPLREALWRSPDVRLGILPSEFCFRYRWGGLVSGSVRVLHGRQNSTPYEQVVKELDGRGMRVYYRRELA